MTRSVYDAWKSLGKQYGQLGLYGAEKESAGPALARRSDPPTSHQAAREVESRCIAESQRMKCLQAVRDFPGQTFGEVAESANLNGEVPHRRLPELERAGFVRRGAARVCSARNTRCQTWWPL